MTRLTALELAGNYPDNVLITSEESSNGKYLALCYLTRDGEVHKLMLSSPPFFESPEKAEKYMHDIAKDIKRKYETDELY